MGATATTDRFGTANMAMSFNGSSQYVGVSDSSSLAIAGFITIVAWIKTTATGTVVIVDKFNSTAPLINAGYSLTMISSGILRGTFHSSSTGIDLNTASGLINDGNWHHCVVVYDGSYAYDYVDGVLKAGPTAYSGGITNTGKALSIGRRTDINAFYFSGSIDEVKIFNRALTATDILSMYNHEKGKFSVGKDGTMRALEFVEDSTLPVQMRSKKKSLTVKGQLIEQ